MPGLGPYYQVNKIANKQQSIKESTYLKAMEPSTLQTILRSLVPHKGAGGYCCGLDVDSSGIDVEFPMALLRDCCDIAVK